jgi:chorismate mutase
MIGASPPSEVASARTRIEAIDRKIVELLATRRALGQAAGEGKRAQGHPLLDPAREAEVVARAAAHARGLGAPEEGVRRIFWAVVHYCRSAQQDQEEGEGGGSLPGAAAPGGTAP